MNQNIREITFEAFYERLSKISQNRIIARISKVGDPFCIVYDAFIVRPNMIEMQHSNGNLFIFRISSSDINCIEETYSGYRIWHDDKIYYIDIEVTNEEK